MLSTSIIFVEIVCILLFASCSKQKSEMSKDISTHLEQAKNQDIPVPISFKFAETSAQLQEKTRAHFVRYYGALSIDDTIQFYRREMERGGWDIIDLSSEQEGFLYCKKPSKQCGIQIRSTGNIQKDNATTLCLFITHKT